MLNKKQLKQLRNEIVLNSLYLCDYSNSFYIKNKTVASFFDGYLEYLDEINGKDNINNLYNYYLLFENDPLIRDDYKAYKNESLFFGCLIYFINDFYVLSASYYTNKEGSMIVNRITKNKLYYDENKSGYYFTKMNKRQYINDFMRA